MSEPSKPAARRAAGVVTEGFKPLAIDPRYERLPIYRVVEVVRDGEGRLRQEGRIWHNDLDLLRRFGRAVAANTSSHRVMITDALGGVIEELPVAAPESRQSSWDTWGGLPLPPAPARIPPRVARAAVATPAVWPSSTVEAEVERISEPVAVAATPTTVAVDTSPPGTAARVPPRDIPKLPMAQSEGTVPPTAEAADGADAGDDAEELASLVPEHEQTLP